MTFSLARQNSWPAQEARETVSEAVSVRRGKTWGNGSGKGVYQLYDGSRQWAGVRAEAGALCAIGAAPTARSTVGPPCTATCSASFLAARGPCPPRGVEGRRAAGHKIGNGDRASRWRGGRVHHGDTLGSGGGAQDQRHGSGIGGGLTRGEGMREKNVFLIFFHFQHYPLSIFLRGRM
jgi:hypothetical protein